LQEDIILSVLDKKDTIALLPTGGGKSVCFQLPGLVLGGTVLVVSPLIALMNDQVQNLKKKGISAVAISSAMNYKEIEIALNNAAYGHVQFLYVSPERLENEDFRKQLSYLPITLIAVDEAHCISQWGYDFRPSYLRIAQVKDYFKDLPIIAVTASATKEVIEDISKKLELKKPQIFRQSFGRKNLRYVVQQEESKTERLLKIIRNIGGSGVVYVKNRKRTEQIATSLNKLKISADFYHAGIKNSLRADKQEKWLNNKFQVMTATNAFGMGIDKPDVRFVVNMDLPDSLESYFQEAGRAGRDGKTAYAVLLFTKKDEEQLLEAIEYAFPELKMIQNCYNAICNYYQVAMNSGQGLSFEFDLDEVAKLYNLHPVLLFNSLKFLEKENYLSLLDAGYEPAKCMIAMTKEDLYAFEVKFPKYESLLKTLVRSYGGIFEQYAFINEKDIAYRIKNTIAYVHEQLEFLTKQEVISYVKPTELPKVILLQDRINSKHIELNLSNYKYLKQRYIEKVNKVIEYANQNTICRQVFLLNYFNELSGEKCGYCDVCLAQKNNPDVKNIEKEILKHLKKETLHIDQLREKLIKFNDELWTSVLNEMIDNGEIKMDRNKHLKIN
jgi:ATP-dependent DNA helicase RecQ